jgi:hypothetical protein
MAASHILLAADYYGPAIGALCFVLGISRVAEPARAHLTRSSSRERAVPT